MSAQTQISPANYNRQQTDLDLSDLLKALKKNIFLELNCHAIATVQSFNSTNQTVRATINYNKTYYQQNSQGAVAPVSQNYPILVDCPVIVLGGGTSSLTFPIAAGDQCVILFNDRDLDNWFAGATVGPVATNRLHSFSDGMALIGFMDDATFDPDRALLQNGQSGVGVSSSKIKIFNATTTLNTQLQQLITDLETFATACSSASSVAQIASAAGTLNTALSSLATAIGGLLE